MNIPEQHKRFADEYLIDLDGKAAYIRAGYKAKGNAAEVNASRLLRNAKVQEYIQKRMKDREKRTEITQDRVLQELAKIGFADIKNYVSFRTGLTIVGHDKDGDPIVDTAHIVELKDSEEVDGSVINEVSVKDGSLKFKLHDKKGALDSMARHLGMFNDNLNLGNKDGKPFETKSALDDLSLEELRALAKSKPDSV